MTKIALSLLLLHAVLPGFGQVAVREEPKHKLVFQNKYIRVLDVWISPGDTTLFHIHETPSLFTHFTTTKIQTQEHGKQWTSDQNQSGKVRFNNFSTVQVHRVTNVDSSVFHVMDIEILQAFDTNYRHRPMPYTILFENKSSVAYQLNENNMGQEIARSRRPSVAQLVSGEDVLYHDQVEMNSKEFREGEFIYIERGSSFYFSSSSKNPVKIIFFEIK